MKRKSLKLAVVFILAMITSCDEPETIITDIVHNDGSVTRKIEMKNTENKFKISDIPVPFDTTWLVRDSLEISEKGDTVWVKRAEKFFLNVDEINASYKADSGKNKDISRHAEFKKSFKWFNTEYRFSEIIDKTLSNGYPIGQFLNQEEIKWLYSPENINSEKLKSADSLKFKAFEDTLMVKMGKWENKCLASEWVNSFADLIEAKPESNLNRQSLKAREDEFVKLLETNEEKFDSLWAAGELLGKIIGAEDAVKYKTEADSALKIVTEMYFIDFSNYIQRIEMPGKLIGTNGNTDSAMVLLWPVQTEFFLTQPYEMWAVSKEPNKWAWIISGLFVLFVVTGIIFRAIKKG
jgi:hypothetical protein